jgi:CDP-diacylglycerol--glycerol-3-phosphate 3-phosphatidyltransferase
VGRPPLTFRRLVGLDRSGPSPPETRRGAPLRPWTLPNAVGYTRVALVPVFLVLAFSSDDGRSTAAAAVYFVAVGADYIDGILARVTGQYSRLGALLDPLVDRLLVISAAVVCWHFDLLPRWALGVLAARELFMLVLTQLAFRRRLELDINMMGRLAVWPTMFGLFLAMVTDTWVAEVSLYLGIAMSLAATALYLRAGLRTAPSTTA